MATNTVAQFKEIGKEAQAPKKSWEKWLMIIAVVSFIYIFIPEPSDVIPIFGWLDELLAGGISFSAVAALVIRYLMNKNKK